MNMAQLSIADIQQLHRNGRLDEAREGYESLLRENPKNVAAIHFLGLLNAEEGKLEAAEENLKAAIGLNPDDVVLYLHLANILKARGSFSEAVRILRDVIQSNPRFAAAFNNLGTVYYAMEKWQEAIDVYQAAIEMQSDYVDAYYNLGLALSKAKRREEAINTFRALIELAPQHAGGRFQLGCLLMQLNQWVAAIDQFHTIEQTHPFHFETQSNLATCFLRLGRLNEARIHYARAVEIMPADVQILFNLGVISMQQGKTNEAIEYYQRALKIDPNAYEAHNNLGVAYLSIRKTELALQHFREALRIQPDNEAIRHTIRILVHDKSLSSSPSEYVRSLFDSYADHYDTHITTALHYQVPKLIYQAVSHNHALKNNAELDILDLGCGTGLCGELFKSSAHTLTGVDISDKMLSVARQKKIYDKLEQSDLLSFLSVRADAYDLIVAGDVFVYFGDLDAIFSAAYQALRIGGLFVFNAEIGGNEDYCMTDSGRFAHNKHYLDSLADRHHFKVGDYQAVSMRTQNEKPVLGHLYLLRK